MAEIVLVPTTVLRLAAKRLLQREEISTDGQQVLRVFYGEHQISFDGDTLDFGRRLVRETRFSASEACAWTDSSPRAWADVRSLLEELVVAGVLEREGYPPLSRRTPPTVLQAVAPSGPTPPLRWHSLQDLCALTSADDRALVPDILEATLGAGLLAQLVTDPSGRQCGENSLAMLAPALTEPVPTEWRTCRYAGSRFEDVRPMNVSGLRQVAVDFDGMVARIAHVRSVFLQRLGRDRLDLGGMWLLAWVFFVVPAWAVRDALHRCSNGEVPEWATALSKTFGGVRETLQLLLVRDGRDLRAAISPDEFVRFTEEEARFLSHTGVCAGTPAMIERIVTVFINGAPRLSTPSIADLDRCLQYGLTTAVLPLVDVAREAHTRILVEEARLSSGQVRRELAARDDEGSATTLLQRAGALCGLLDTHIDIEALPLIPEQPLEQPAGRVLLAVLGVEMKAVSLAMRYQARINAALGITQTPSVTRRDVGIGLSAIGRRLWGDILAEDLDWTIGEDENGLALAARGRTTRLRRSA